MDGLEWLVGALLLAGVGLVVLRRVRAAILPAAVGGGGAALMALAALGGADYLNNRNTLPVLAIALAVPALGFAAGRRAGEVLGAAACVAMAVATVGALTDPAHAREDWRATARDLGATSRSWWSRPTPTCRCAGTARASSPRRRTASR